MISPFKKFCYRTYQFGMKLAVNIFDWSEPELLSGVGSVKKLPEFVKAKGITNVLVVTDKGLMGLHLLDPLFENLDKVGVKYTVFDGVQPNPSIQNIEDARELYLKNNCQGLIAFGGGSPMDCAKACAARIARPNLPVPKMKGVLKVIKKIPLSLQFPQLPEQALKQLSQLLFQILKHMKNMQSTIPFSVRNTQLWTLNLQWDFLPTSLQQQVWMPLPMQLRLT